MTLRHFIYFTMKTYANFVDLLPYVRSMNFVDEKNSAMPISYQDCKSIFNDSTDYNQAGRVIKPAHQMHFEIYCLLIA